MLLRLLAPAVFQIRSVLVWIHADMRIRTTKLRLRSLLFSLLAFKMPQISFFLYLFLLITYRRYFLSTFKDDK
jgi:hypothetical protein